MKKISLFFTLICTMLQLAAQDIYEKYDITDESADGLYYATDVFNKKGVIDKTGQIIIPFEYDYINIFSEGLIIVKSMFSFIL